MYFNSFTLGANNACTYQSPKTFIGLLDSYNQPLINNRRTCERPFSCTDDGNHPVGRGRVFSNLENRFTIITKVSQVHLWV